MAENNISVIFLAVVRFTGKRRIYEHIFAGTLASGHLYAIGYFAEKGLLALMSYNGIEELTRVKSDLRVQSAGSGL